MKKVMMSFFCLAWIALSGCTHANAPGGFQPLDAEIIHKSTTCGKMSDMPNALWLTDKAKLATIFDKMNRRRIGGSLPDWGETFNFNEFGILFVHMGRKPTGGFHLEYIPGHAYVSGQTATVLLKWMTPAADDMVTQMITHPCLMLKLPKADFTRIEILDQHGKLKAAINRKAPEK